MPVPKYPKEGEKSQDYVSRCIEYCIKYEGLTQKQAAGKCYGMLRQKRGESATPRKSAVKNMIKKRTK